MVTVPGSRFPVSGCSVFGVLRWMISAIAVFIFGCGEQTNNTPANDTVQQSMKFTGLPTPISNTGLTIDLIEGYAIDSQIDSNFKVYYFKPESPNAAEDEAGIYIGLHPDTSSPSIGYDKKIFDGVFMSNSVKWTEFTTEKYTQREVFVDRGPEEKIHSWCYSHDPATLEKLFSMIKTIR